MEYSIRDLVRLSGETKRTIRWYTQEGLLPKPGRSGREAVYGEEHLLRLRQIRMLQAQGYKLPQVRERLGPGRRSGMAPTDSALRKRIPAYQVPTAQRADRPEGRAKTSASRPGTELSTPRSEVWRRVVITPGGIELHVKGKSAKLAARLERALRLAIGDSID